jgi:hypothetical protein
MIVTVEVNAVEVSRLALVPVRRRREIDDRCSAPVNGRDAFELDRAVGSNEGRAYQVAGGVQAGETRAAFE